MSEEKTPEQLLTTVVTESDRYAVRRKLALKTLGNKKLSLEKVRQEIIAARVLGELSAAERILQAITTNSDWSKEDIEAELHVFVKDLNNVAAEYLNTGRIIGVEDVLKIYGYFEEGKDERKDKEMDRR